MGTWRCILIHTIFCKFELPLTPMLKYFLSWIKKTQAISKVSGRSQAYKLVVAWWNGSCNPKQFTAKQPLCHSWLRVRETGQVERKPLSWKKRLLGISSSPGQCHGLLFRACRRQEPGAPVSEQNLKESRVPESSSLSQRGRSRPEVFSAAGNLTGHINKSKRKSIPGLATRYSLGSQHKPPGLKRSYLIRKV